MALLPTGSDELLYIRTDKVSVTIKGAASHPSFQGIEYSEGDSELRVSCDDPFDCTLKGQAVTGAMTNGRGSWFGRYVTAPVFFEQQRYELIIEAAEGCSVAFWHDNINIRNKVTEVGRSRRILSGILNFGNEIGLSDLVVQVDGANYLRLVIEVFPTKISYREDYRAIVEDVTREVYNVVFDFLKKTYLGYQQSDKVSSSPMEFFAVIRKIYRDFLRAADVIIARPHHILETTHAVLPAHKVKQVDGRGLRWVEKHPEHVRVTTKQVLVSKALAVKKQVTYDTRENRLTRYILQTTAKKLERFRKNYLRLQREEDLAVIEEIDGMIQSISRRVNSSILAEVGSHDVTAGTSLVFSMAPGYRDLYRYYLMLLRGLEITGDVFNISVKDLAVLYEYWCFIKLNSLMKERYELVSQDIVKVQGNGLFVSLVKGKGSRVKYRDPGSGEVITLSYNPKEVEVPTVAQRPDNVLTLKKKGADVSYEYVFDAKYRVNPALPGTDYYTSVSHRPGPEVGDINTMHRYRDAIVYRNGASPYERIMFGAYVLFPYHNEEEYRSHRFYESIGKVNIGGLPFLPSAVGLVTQLLDELIADSPESAFERTTLPVGIEEKLAKVDWDTRDVLVGGLGNRRQLEINLRHRFYHIPARQIRETDLPVRTVALYQSKRLFGTNAGVRYYGDVIRCTLVRRRDISESPKESDDLYYRLDVKEWKELSKPIQPKEIPLLNLFTNRFLLEHCSEVPELKLRSEEEYRLYHELKRALNSTEINEEGKDTGFRFHDALVIFEDGKINVYRNGTIVEQKSVDAFSKSPSAVFRGIQKAIEATYK